MVKMLRRFFGHYVDYHEHGPLLLHYLSLLGLVGFPLLYSVRFVRPTIGYDDLWIRVFDAVICLGLFLGNRWPQRLRPFYMPYSYAGLINSLPPTFVFTPLNNGVNHAAGG